MVCKQWRVASAHEDFWRSLDFENRSISVAQCKFYLDRERVYFFNLLVAWLIGIFLKNKCTWTCLADILDNDIGSGNS